MATERYSSLRTRHLPLSWLMTSFESPWMIARAGGRERRYFKTQRTPAYSARLLDMALPSPTKPCSQTRTVPCWSFTITPYVAVPPGLTASQAPSNQAVYSSPVPCTIAPVRVNTLVWNTCRCVNASSIGHDGLQSHNYGLLTSEAGVTMEVCSSCCQASVSRNQSARCLLRFSRSIGSQQEWSCGSSCIYSGIWSVALSVAWHTYPSRLVPPFVLTGSTYLSTMCSEPLLNRYPVTAV